MRAGLCRGAAAARPPIAVLDFSTQGLTSDWYGAFQPGVALSDLLTDRMVNGGRFNVLDRTHLSSTLGEHQLGASGEVSPEAPITAGHMVGARYLVTGNILQLDQTGESGASAGSLLPGVFGAAAGGVSTHRVTIKVAVRVIDARTGRDRAELCRRRIALGNLVERGRLRRLCRPARTATRSSSTATWGISSTTKRRRSPPSLDPSRFNAAPAAPALTGQSPRSTAATSS